MNTTSKWNSFNTSWVISLFGTAVGAGILYLPIKAGGGGNLACNSNVFYYISYGLS